MIVSETGIAKHFSVCKDTIRKWRNSGKIPYMRCGNDRTIRYDVEKVEEALSQMDNKLG